MFCPLCRNAMNYERFEDTYRCTKTDFHLDRDVVITVGLTKFKGTILKKDDDIEKSHVLLVLRKSRDGVSRVLDGSDITVHPKPRRGYDEMSQMW